MRLVDSPDHVSGLCLRLRGSISLTFFVTLFSARLSFFLNRELCRQDFTPTCSTSGRGSVILGDGLGMIRIFDRDYKCKAFAAHDVSVSCVFQLKRSNILISLGSDADATAASV